jgi:hypothetical protein
MPTTAWSAPADVPDDPVDEADALALAALEVDDDLLLPQAATVTAQTTASATTRQLLLHVSISFSLGPIGR